MKSALECYYHASRCERMAADSLDRASRMMLCTLAEHWRVLGHFADKKKFSEAQDPWPPTPGPEGLVQKTRSMP